MTRILIVDDKEENLFLLRCLLTSQDCAVEYSVDCTVDCAYDGAEALVKARHSPPDLIISDLLMPVMDGYTLLRHWKNDVRLKKVPFIIYTATYTDPEDERLALSMGADAFILKPANPEAFLTKVREVQAKAAAAVPTVQNVPAGDEKEVLRAYSQTLVRKLEEKTSQLEESNRALQRDVAEREKAEEAQRRMAETQMGILNALPAHIALLDSHGVIVAVNEAWRRFASANVLQSSDFFVGQNYLGVCESAHGECSEESRAVATGMRKVLSGEAQDFAIEYPCHSPTEQRWFRLMVTPLSETPGTGVVVMHINVTERRAAEEILSQKEREQRRLAEELTIETQRLYESQAVGNVGSWETDIATLDGTWTEETFRIFETSPEEFTPTHQGFLERIHPEDRGKVDDAFKRSLGEQGPFTIGYRILFPDGRIKFVEERWRTFNDQSGKPVRAVGTCQDITRQVTALAELVQSEERFRRLYERVPDAIQLIDQQGVILDVNPATETLSGYPESELIGRNFLQLPLLQGGDLSRAKENLVRNAEGRGTGPAEYAVHRKDGKVITMEFEGFPIRIGEQDLVLGVGRDITERKAAEELIAIRGRQQEAIAKIGFEATRATTLESIFDFATRAVAQALGVELCKVLQLVPDGSNLRLVSGVGWQAGLIGVGTVGVDRESQAGFTLKSDGPIYVNDFAKETRFTAPPILRQHDVVSGLSVKILLRDKPWGVLGAHCRTARSFNGADSDFMQAVATLLAVVIERLAVQHTLTESEARMRDAQRIAHLGNWEVDLATNKVNWSEEAFRIFGVDPGNFSPTYEAFLALVHPNDLEAMRAAHENAVSGKGPLEIEHGIIRGDGAVRVVRERGELIHDENGAPIALSGTVLDITDLRAAQSRAERMNALLTEAQRIADMGSWEMDLTTGRLVWSEETCRLFGIQPGAFGGTFEEFIGFILPEDRPAYSAIHAKITPTAPLLEAEYRIRRPDGTVRWMFERGMVTFDSAGKVTRRLGVVMDITGRRKNEEQLRLLETCVSRLNDIVLITEAEPIDDPGPRILYVNDAFVRRTGFTREEAIGQTPRLLQGPKTQRDALDRIRAALKAWKPVREELINYTKSGEEFWLELDIVPVADATGWFTHWVAIERDITERKQAEEQLRHREQLLRIAGEVARMGGWSVDFPEVRITWSDEVCAIHDMPAGTVPTLEQGLSFYTPESRPVIESAFSLCASEGTPFDVECEVLTAKGRRIWVRSIGQAERDDAGAIRRVQGAFQDISEQKVAELEIIRTNRALKMLSACNEALIHAVDEGDLLKVICEIAVDSGGYRMAWVGYAQEDAKRTIQPMAHAGEEAGYLTDVTITWEENTPEGSGPAGRTIRTGQPSMSEDMEQDAGFHWRDVARQRGYRSVICLPLRADNRTFGLLGLYSAEVLQASVEEIKLLQELADDLAFGIGHLRAQRESERIRNAVTRVATAVSASTGTEFFEQLAHNMAEALGASAAFVAEFSTGKQRATCTLGAVVDGKIVENFEYLLEGTPCENLTTSETFVVERQAAAQFPGDAHLAALGAQAYVGKRLDHSTGRPLGHLCVIFREPLKHVQFVTSTLQIFAARAASELERRQTDAQLREQAALLDAAHEAIQVKDMEGRITYWNKGAEMTYGWTAAEVLGRKACDFLYANHARFQEVFASVLERETWAGEMERHCKSGHSITVESRWTLVCDTHGRPKSILVIATDLTERRRAEKELAQARENMLVELEQRVAERTESLYAATQEAERANRAKSEFLSRMSHELRTPLHAILGFAQILEMDAQNADDAESVAQIVRAGNHLLGLINEVLDIARVESGSLAFTPEPVSLRATLEEAISLLQPQASERRVQLAALTGDADCEVLSSEQRFKQVVINLLSNAVKFNREGGSVTVSCAKLEDRVRIKITDTGSGISAENVKKLFVPFERLDVGDRVIEGTGLGLSLSKHLVEAMGGRIGVESTPGQGSTFWLELPRIERTTAATERSLDGPEHSDDEPPRATAPRTVLYIEDNLSNSRLVQRILARRPEVKLISAMQGSLGLELARQHHPDLVLLDLHLPDLPGDEILRQLRADPRTAQLPIVMISADATAPQIARLRDLGATDYLTKPIDVRKFLALVDAIEPRPA